MKRVLVLVLTAIMLLGVFASCTGGGTAPSTTTSAQTKAETTAPATPPTKVVMSYTGIVPADVKLVQEEINKLTVPKINVAVELLPLEGANYGQQVNLMLTSREKLDLMQCTPTPAASFATMSSQNMLMDLSTLAPKYAQGIIDAFNSVNPKYLDGTKVNGKLYGFTCLFDKASGVWVSFRKDMMDKYKLDPTKVKSMKDIEDILAVLKKGETIAPWYSPWCGMVTLVNPDDFSKNTDYDSLGDGNYRYGMVIGTDNTKVVNVFATDWYKRMCEIANDWYKKGYVYKDAATTTEISYALVQNNSAIGIVNQGETEHPLTIKPRAGYDMVNVNLGNAQVTTSIIQKFAWTVPVTCTVPEAALKFLNLTYTDKDILNLLNFGIKGKHYVENPDGTIKQPPGVTAGTNPYRVMGSFEFGNAFLVKVWEPGPVNLRQMALDNNKKARVSPLMGISINNKVFSNELTAVTNVLEQYRKGLENGVSDTAKVLPQFLKALDDAGMPKIIAEVQKQVDAFVATKK